MSKLRVGLIGCGHISSAHIKAWRKAHACEVTGVFDLNRDLAAKRAKEFGITLIHESVDDLVDKSDVVDISTPPASHAKLALQAIQAGKHVLIEKPVVVEESDWDLIVKAMKSSPGKLGVIHNIKVGNAIQKAKQLIDAGKIGELIRIERQFLTHTRHDRMLTDQPHWSHDLPGGRWFETLPHELYLTHYFAGPSELVSVAANRTPAATRAVKADEVTLTFKNERCITVIHYSSNCHLNRRNITFTGTRGVIFVDILSDVWTLNTLEDSTLRRGLGLEYLNSIQRLTHLVPERAGYALRRLKGMTPHAKIIMQFADHIRGEAEAPTPFDEVDYTIRNCYKVGRAIDAQFAIS